jgi:hypothetical protein
MRSYSALRNLQEAHNGWLEALFTQARPVLDAALRDLFRTRPELAAVSWTVTRSARANFALIVTGVELRRRDGTIIRVDDDASQRHYRGFIDLLVANAEILSAAVMACPAHVVATPDGQLAVTTSAS